MNGKNSKKMIEFFIPLKKVPTVTHQQKRATNCSDGKIRFYEDESLKSARLLLTAHVGKYAPSKKIQGAIRLTTKWCFPKRAGKVNGQYKTTKPDTDNLIKLFKDCMTDVGFWNDDAQVASEITEKFWSDITGIYVKVESLE